jgi:hypothetical protein
MSPCACRRKTLELARELRNYAGRAQIMLSRPKQLGRQPASGSTLAQEGRRRGR